MASLSGEVLKNLYLVKGKSAKEIADAYGCSPNKINYWLKKYDIQKRTISESQYLRKNPNGDPFQYIEPKTIEDSFLFGLGMGLYWGEGNKRNSNTVRLGNTDPRLIKAFIQFLKHIYGVKESKFRFGLQIFSDMQPDKALRFWCKELGVSSNKFGKVIVTPARSIGTYREKSKYGVLTIYVSNKRLRDLLCSKIENL